jgi:hypothetical protein
MVMSEHERTAPGWATGILPLKGVLLTALVTLSVSPAAAQIGIKLMQFRPTGDLGYVVERKWTPEFLYIQDFEEKTRMRASFLYMNLQPRLDTFPTTGLISDSNGFRVLPGWQTFSKINMYLITGGLDYAVVELFDYDLALYPGLDIIFGGIGMEYESYTPEISSSGFSGGFMIGGLRLRLGAEWAFNDHFGANFEWSTATYYQEEGGRYTFNDLGIGVRYQF